MIKCNHAGQNDQPGNHKVDRYVCKKQRSPSMPRTARATPHEVDRVEACRTISSTNCDLRISTTEITPATSGKGFHFPTSAEVVCLTNRVERRNS
jgi:hypothetical protein